MLAKGIRKGVKGVKPLTLHYDRERDQERPDRGLGIALNRLPKAHVVFGLGRHLGVVHHRLEAEGILHSDSWGLDMTDHDLAVLRLASEDCGCFGLENHVKTPRGPRFYMSTSPWFRGGVGSG